jgi:hypothetical protein
MYLVKEATGVHARLTADGRVFQQDVVIDHLVQERVTRPPWKPEAVMRAVINGEVKPKARLILGGGNGTLQRTSP